jgi:hypothetical protein
MILNLLNKLNLLLLKIKENKFFFLSKNKFLDSNISIKFVYFYIL